MAEPMKMRNIVWVVFFALSGCEEQDAEEPADEPEAVQPVEVVTDDGEQATAEEEPDDDEEIVRLRARVTELEAELATCRAGAVVPEGVEAPAQNTNTDPAARPRDAGVPRDAGRRRRDDPQTIRLPDPTGILFPR
jgi:hypothetical protein